MWQKFSHIKPFINVSVLFVPIIAIFLTIPLLSRAQTQSQSQTGESTPSSPTLQDFWDGRAEWVVDLPDVGLPIGESDTISRGNGVFWSYLHASNQSAGVIDQCGEPVAFPGCMTRWESVDGGKTFTLPVAVCSMSCGSCPCQDQRDQVGLDENGIPRAAQQYPRIAVADNSDGSTTYY
ncbi:MAG TPA: hypothetical protein VHL11_00400, partial [Phototrophicaceae bacterium]|nr:hypothetical protein [Phototrophicaceae bacterium]